MKIIKKFIGKFKRKETVDAAGKVRMAIKEYYDSKSLRNLYYLIDSVDINCLGESSEVKIQTVETDLVGALIGSGGNHIKGLKRLITDLELIEGDFKIQIN